MKAPATKKRRPTKLQLAVGDLAALELARAVLAVEGKSRSASALDDDWIEIHALDWDVVLHLARKVAP